MNPLSSIVESTSSLHDIARLKEEAMNPLSSIVESTSSLHDIARLKEDLKETIILFNNETFFLKESLNANDSIRLDKIAFQKLFNRQSNLRMKVATPEWEWASPSIEILDYQYQYLSTIKKEIEKSGKPLIQTRKIIEFKQDYLNKIVKLLTESRNRNYYVATENLEEVNQKKLLKSLLNSEMIEKILGKPLIKVLEKISSTLSTSMITTINISILIICINFNVDCSFEMDLMKVEIYPIFIFPKNQINKKK